MSKNRLLAVVVLVCAAVWAFPQAAQAHAALISTTPPAGSAVPRSPDSVTLVFSEEVGLGARAVTLSGDGGVRVSVDPPELASDGHAVRMRLRAPLPDGTYTVHWQVTAGDGDLVRGSYRFGVGDTPTDSAAAATLSDPSAGGSDTPELGLVVVLRWVLFCGLAILAGGVTGGRLARRYEADAPAPVPSRWLWQGALVGLAASGGLAAHLAGGGSVLTGLRRPDLSLLTASTAGRLLLVEATAFALAILVTLFPVRALRVAEGPDVRPGETHSPAAPGRRGPVPAWVAAGADVVVALASVAVAVAEGLRGHPHEDAGLLGTALTTPHVLAAAMWVGALVYVARVGHAWRARRGQGWLLVWDYARLAAALFVVVAVTGAVASLVVVPTPGAVTATGYGRTLLVKLALVAAVAVLAVLAHQRFVRAPAPEAGIPPSGPARVEAAALVCVLAATAVLVSLAPDAPTRTERAAPAVLPPPVVGPAVSLGTMSGQVTVGMTASHGQLRLQLHAPDPDPNDEQNQTVFHATATLRDPRGGDHRLSLRDCGGGCYTAPADWQRGTNTVSVQVDATPWHAGDAAFDVPWPPRTNTTAVAEAVAAVRAAGRLTVHERITSDTTPDQKTGTGAGGLQETLPISAADFLRGEPYGGGVAPPAVVLGQDRTSTQLAFAYLSEGIYVRLWVSPDGRAVREEIAAPNEHITRTFDYP